MNFEYLGNKQKRKNMELNDGPVTYSLNMEAIDVTYGMWMEECANAPRCIMVGFESLERLRAIKDDLFKGFENVDFPIGEYEKMGRNHYRMFFSFSSKEEFNKWYRNNFFAEMRKIAVEFYKKENFVPVNFKPYFVDINVDDTIHIPSGSGYNHYSLNDAAPAFTGQELNATVVKDSHLAYAVVKFKELTIPYSYAACHPGCATVSISDLFDYDKFIRDYID